jgi:hypothetical protein
MERDLMIKIKDLKKFRFTRYIWDDNRENLKNTIIKEGFDNENFYLTITKDFYILDGNHRFYTMLNNFEQDYEVRAKVYDVSIKTLIFLSIISSILFFPVVLFHYVKLEYKIRKNKIPNEFKRNR